MDHDHVVRYLDSFIEDGNLYIVMEWCDKGDLSVLMRRFKARGYKALNEQRTWVILLQMYAPCLHFLNTLQR